mgnify:CR=1 FL=1
MCAARVGQNLNMSSLSNDCGVSVPTVKSWISILESSFIIKLIYPYYKNFNKRLVKSPKLYFFDTGLLCRLLSIKEEGELEAHALRGNVFENFIFLEFLKLFYNHGIQPPIYFWCEKNGNEIDLIVDQDPLALIEIKAGKTISSSYFANIQHFKKSTGRSQPSYVVYAGTGEQKRSQGQVISWKNLKKIFEELSLLKELDDDT